MELAWQKVVQSLNFTLVATLVNFALLMGVLTWLLYRPAREFLQRRRERIRSRINNAQQREDKAEELVEKRKSELQEARQRAQQIIANAEDTAERIKQESRDEADREAERIIQQAREEARREGQKVRQELKSEYVNAAITGAEQILRREVKVEDHREMVDRLLERVEEGKLSLE